MHQRPDEGHPDEQVQDDLRAFDDVAEHKYREFRKHAEDTIQAFNRFKRAAEATIQDLASIQVWWVRARRAMRETGKI